tara:strand:+ start:9234 stop:9707 length:474 start_codon:yes stop_codon:yes gene_type:complete
METNEITLNYLTNPIYLKKNDNKNQQKYTEEDKQFYKKRIIMLNKFLLKSSNINDEQLLKQHDIFVSDCIKYFKKIDKGEILQQEYKDLSYNNFISKDISYNTQTINNNLFKKLDKKTTLDNFVENKTQTNTQLNIPPLQRKVNLKDKKFRKKKNII